MGPEKRNAVRNGRVGWGAAFSTTARDAFCQLRFCHAFDTQSVFLLSETQFFSFLRGSFCILLERYGPLYITSLIRVRKSGATTMSSRRKHARPKTPLNTRCIHIYRHLLPQMPSYFAHKWRYIMVTYVQNLKEIHVAVVEKSPSV